MYDRAIKRVQDLMHAHTVHSETSSNLVWHYEPQRRPGSITAGSSSCSTGYNAVDWCAGTLKKM